MSETNTFFIKNSSGVIYQNPNSSGLSVLPIARNLFFTTIVQATGYTAMIMAVFSLAFLSWPIVAVELAYRLNRIASSTTTDAVEELAPHTFGEIMEIVDTPEPIVATIPDNHEFGLVIPKIGVNTSVFVDTDVSDSNVYLPILQKGVAHAKGTYLPGQGGTIFVFGHSTDSPWNIQRMNAQFYLLKELVENDEIVVFYNNKKFIYRVVSKTIADSTDVSFLEPKKDGEVLILQTCWPPGTTWNRYIVSAVPVLDK